MICENDNCQNILKRFDIHIVAIYAQLFMVTVCIQNFFEVFNSGLFS